MVVTVAEILIAADDEAAIVTARGAVRELARSVGFGVVDQTRIATAVSEIVRNVVLYAKRGTVEFTIHRPTEERRELRVVVEDEGPGIEDVQRVLEGGYSTSNGFGRGIAGARALVDELRIASEPGKGTRVEMRKWS